MIMGNRRGRAAMMRPEGTPYGGNAVERAALSRFENLS